MVVDSLFEKVIEQAKNLEQKTRTKITFQSIDAKSIPAPMDESMQKLIIQSAIELGYSYKFMPSGAGHDAQNMATIVPTGMIFMPGVGGISHSPKEYTRPGDMVKGANVLLHSVLKIDKDGLD